jgi:hypothetical protein
MERRHGLQIPAHNVLLSLMRTFHIKDASIVLSLEEDWAMCLVLIKVVSRISRPVAASIEGHWELLLRQVSLKEEELDVLSKAFL